MKKTTVIILSILFLMLGCKVKRVSKLETKKRDVIEYSKDIKEIDIQNSKIEIKDFQKQKVDQDKKEVNSDIEIRGKSDKDNPVSFYNVVNGDTIDLLKVTGNADIIFKSRNSILTNNSNKNIESNKNKSESTSKENKGIISSVVEKASTIQNKTVAVVKRDFQAGVYITGFLITAIALILFALYFYFKRK